MLRSDQLNMSCKSQNEKRFDFDKVKEFKFNNLVGAVNLNLESDKKSN